MKFEEILSELRGGANASRTNWSDPVSFICFMAPLNVTIDRTFTLSQSEQTQGVVKRKYINTLGTIIMVSELVSEKWTPSHDDILADDWFIVK